LPALTSQNGYDGIGVVSFTSIDFAGISHQRLFIDLASAMLDWDVNDQPVFTGMSAENLAEQLQCDDKDSIEQCVQALKQTSTDHLVGLANRYNLEKMLNKSWNDSLVNNQPISLILIDVDYFKHFNDQFGHVSGDKCLQKTAKVIDDCLPSKDSLAARYGGEEFAVILPRSHTADAELVARQIQQQINIINFSDLGLPSTVSVSVSQGNAYYANIVANTVPLKPLFVLQIQLYTF
jgi:diguanylate cyclase (GGDEF)-like protein